jgi:hypothetical protein
VIESKVTSARQGRYESEIAVRYRAAGQVLEKRLSSGATTSSLTLAESELAQYPPDSRCLLALNPDDPQDIRLNPGLTEVILIGGLSVGGLLFLLIPVGVVALSQRRDATRLVGHGFAGIGLGMMLLGGGLGWHKTQILKNWPSTEATVVSSGKVGGGRRSRLVLELAYTVNSTQYVARTGSSWSGSGSLVDQSLLDWTPGSRHNIHLRPGAPDLIDFEAAWNLAYFWPVAVIVLVGASTTAMGALIARFLPS